MTNEILFIGFTLLMVVLMIIGMYYKIGLFNLLSAGIGLYLILEVVKYHEGETPQLMAIGSVFIGLIIYNFYYTFFGNR